MLGNNLVKGIMLKIKFNESVKKNLPDVNDSLEVSLPFKDDTEYVISGKEKSEKPPAGIFIVNKWLDKSALLIRYSNVNKCLYIRNLHEKQPLRVLVQGKLQTVNESWKINRNDRFYFGKNGCNFKTELKTIYESQPATATFELIYHQLENQKLNLGHSKFKISCNKELEITKEGASDKYYDKYIDRVFNGHCMSVKYNDTDNSVLVKNELKEDSLFPVYLQKKGTKEEESLNTNIGSKLVDGDMLIFGKHRKKDKTISKQRIDGYYIPIIAEVKIEKDELKSKI